MARMRWVSVVALLGGCYSPVVTPGLACTPDTHRCPADLQCDPHTNTCVSELEPPCSQFGPWGPTTPLPFSTALQPALSPDGATLVVSTIVTGRGGDLYVATWDASANAFVNPQPIDTVNTTADDVFPAWSADGTVLYFASDAGLMRSAVSPGPTFGAAVPSSEFAAVGAVRHLRFTWDDLDVFFWDDTPKLRHAHRASRNDTWLDASGDLAMLDEPVIDERDPAIDAEALRIIYSLDDTTLREASRPDRNAAFGNSQVIDGTGTMSVYEPDLSRDGLRLFFTMSSGTDRVYTRTRTCEAH